MRLKLEYSRNILAGLASEDYDKIAKNAEAMQGMSKFEGFIRGKMPGYRAQLQVFQSANEELIRQAQNDNVEGAALAFTQVTVSCVNCHKQLRAAAPQPSVPAPKREEP
jgi:cytochrome c556